MVDYKRYTKSLLPKKKINVEKEVESCTAFVCGLGQFNFFVNGQKVEDHVMDPGWTNYKIIQYVTFDLTEKINIGANVLAVGT